METKILFHIRQLHIQTEVKAPSLSLEDTPSHSKAHASVTKK